MIKSVANWWWVNVHDDECTAGNEMAPWVKNMTTVTMENTYDELPGVLERQNGKSEKSKKNQKKKKSEEKVDEPKPETIELDLGLCYRELAIMNASILIVNFASVVVNARMI